MFDMGLGFGEIILLGIMALIVIGPQDFPRAMYRIGQFFQQLRGMAASFRHEMEDIACVEEMRQMRRQVDDEIDAVMADPSSLESAVKNKKDKMPELGSDAAL